ncbi:MAG: tetratricopeptide repeat protein [Pseudomonadota bacterium]
MTGLAASVLNQDRKESIALWLMGAQSEETWAKSFTALFDAIFGKNHLSPKCFLRSALASLLAVVLIWALMGWGGTYDARLEGGEDLWRLLGLALIINIFADYVSLLETRWLLGWLSSRRPVVVQILALIADLLISAAIIWVAIWGMTTALQIENDTLAETLGVFSPFSILFYSTFLTSLWSWAFIASTWIIRLVAGLRLAEWSQLPGAPLRFLGLIMGSAVFLGALAAASVFRQDEHGVTVLDELLCDVFQGEVCLAVMRLTEDEERQLAFLLGACQGGLTEECFSRAFAAQGTSDEEAGRLYEAACAGGDARGCTNLGFLHNAGLGRAVNYEEAARFYQMGCDGRNARGCTNLGILHDEGLGRAVDYDEAARLYQMGCDGGDAIGCSNLGGMNRRGDGMPVNLEEAARLYQIGCDMGHETACTWADQVRQQLEELQ